MPTQIRVKGLDEFRKELNKADKRMGKAFGLANEKVGRKVVEKGVPAVVGLPTPSGGQATLKSSKTQRAAVVFIGGKNDATLANVLGTLSHMVWGRRVAGRGPFQPWLGQSWSPEDLYGVGPVIRDVVDGFALDEYMDAVLDGLAAAFPD